MFAREHVCVRVLVYGRTCKEVSASKEHWRAEGRGEKETYCYGPFCASCLRRLSYSFFKIKCKKLMGRVLKRSPGRRV